jgi:hypothetical protein
VSILGFRVRSTANQVPVRVVLSGVADPESGAFFNPGS